MKKILVMLGAAAVIFSACNGGGAPTTEQDSVAYAVGLDLGTYVKGLDSTMNVDVVATAMKDAISGNQQMTQEDAYAFLREYFTVRKPAKVKAASEAFLADIEKQDGVQKTESGLLYKVEEMGDANVMANSDEDTVKVVYHGTLKDGKVFDSSRERGDTASFALNKVIKAWTEGMKLVGKGGKITLWVPSELGYGEQGAGQQIGPNEALIFEVDVVDVVPANK